MFKLDPRQQVRLNTHEFRPPLPNRWLQETLHSLLPFLFRTLLNRFDVAISAESLDRLKALRGQRCLLLPNHPTEWDPWTMMDVGRRLDEHFYFVAAREVFDYSYGLRGWLFQRVCVYSLVRGANDRESFKTSMDTLSQNRGRLVIFVEGEISNQNDALLPMEPGVLQLAMMALNDQYRQCGKNLEALPSLYICPVSLRYHYHSPKLERRIDEALARLEVTVGLPITNAARYDRIHALAETILAMAAAQYGFPLPAEQTMAGQVQTLVDFMLTKLEQVINLPPEATLDYLDRVRRIRNLVDKQLQLAHEAETVYQKRLLQHQSGVLRHFYQDLDRIVNFVAIYDGYLHPQMTTDRTVEMLRRLEREVYGVMQFCPPRTAHVSVGEPIDLREHFAAFQADKKATLNTLAQQVEIALYTGLKSADLKTQEALLQA